MDIIVYLCGMNFTSQKRYNPKTGRDERYYRLKESYRNALGRSCTRILLNVGFIDDLQPEEMRDISRALTYKYEHQDETELWPDPLCVYSDRVRERALEYWGEMVKLGSLDIIGKAYEASKAKAERHVDTETLEHRDARDIGAEWLCLQASSLTSICLLELYSGFVLRSFWNKGESLYSSLSTEFMSSFNVISLPSYLSSYPPYSKYISMLPACL